MKVKYRKKTVDFDELSNADIFYAKIEEQNNKVCKLIKCEISGREYNSFLMSGDNKGRWYVFDADDRVRISTRQLLDDYTIDADEEDDADSVEDIDT